MNKPNSIKHKKGNLIYMIDNQTGKWIIGKVIGYGYVKYDWHSCNRTPEKATGYLVKWNDYKKPGYIEKYRVSPCVEKARG